MQSPTEANELISVSGVGLTRANRTILHDVNLDVRRGDFLAITGPNGGGKTTLLRIILRLLKPTQGRVEYFDNNMRIGYLPQKNMIDSSFPITVEEVVASGLLALKLPADEQRRRTDEAIAMLRLDSRRDYTIDRISGGQLQRTLIARALVASPQLLVLDEPLSYLDKDSEQTVYDIIESLKGECTTILVSHEMSRIATMANRHVIVDRTVEECHAGHHYFAIDCPCPPNVHGHRETASR